MNNIIKIACISILLMGCSAAKLLQRSELLKMKAIAKGARVQKDTVWMERPVKIVVPEFNSSAPVNPVIDSGAFWTFMPSYDSLLREYDKLKNGVGLEVSEREKKLRGELYEARKRLAKGFYKDTIYNIDYDSNTRVTLVLKDGAVKIVKLTIKRHEVTGTNKVPILINDSVSAGYTTWQMIGAGFSGVVLAACGIGIWLWLRLRKQQVEELKQRTV